jgi:hypothetical protein
VSEVLSNYCLVNRLCSCALYIHTYAYIYIHTYIHTYIHISILLSIYLSIYLSYYLSIYLSIYPSIYLSIYIYTYICSWYVYIMYTYIHTHAAGSAQRASVLCHVVAQRQCQRVVRGQAAGIKKNKQKKNKKSLVCRRCSTPMPVRRTRTRSRRTACLRACAHMSLNRHWHVVMPHSSILEGPRLPV